MNTFCLNPEIGPSHHIRVQHSFGRPKMKNHIGCLVWLNEDTFKIRKTDPCPSSVTRRVDLSNFEWAPAWARSIATSSKYVCFIVLGALLCQRPINAAPMANQEPIQRSVSMCISKVLGSRSRPSNIFQINLVEMIPCISMLFTCVESNSKPQHPIVRPILVRRQRINKLSIPTRRGPPFLFFRTTEESRPSGSQTV